MQQSHDPQAHILSEADIRITALNGANLIPKNPSDAQCAEALSRLEKLSDDLLYTINHTDLSGGHKTAACNLLCTVISQSVQSTLDDVCCLVWTKQIWLRAFEIFLTQNHALSVKPLRQLLTTLTSVLDKGRNSSIVQTEKTQAIRRLAGIICSTAEHVPIRPAMQALAYFLQKRVMDARQMFEAISDVRGDLPGPVDVNAQHTLLMETTLKWAPYDDYSSAAGLLASAILENIRVQSDQSRLAVVSFHSDRCVPWIGPVLNALLRDSSLVETYRNYVLPELFKHDLQDFIVFCETLGFHQILEGGRVETDFATNISTEHLENLLFCTLSVGTKVGLVHVGEPSGDSRTGTAYLKDNALCIPDALLGQLILRPSATIRIAALSMLIASNSTTKPLSFGSIKALKNGLPYLHADADPGFRSEMFSLIRILLDRTRGATTSLSKLSGGHASGRGNALSTKGGDLRPKNTAMLLLAHRRFLEWYIQFLNMELRPSASYQRHISAIKCILLVYRSGVDSRIPVSLRAKTASSTTTWPFHLNVINESLTDSLLDLLLNPFDDIRQGAAEILGIAPTTNQGGRKSDHIVTVLHKAEVMMMQSGRADHADGAAHLYNIIFAQCSDRVGADTSLWWASKFAVLEHLVSKLENTLSLAAHDLTKAVSKHPLHGIFVSLRYIMETSSFYKMMVQADAAALQSIHLRLYSCFDFVWSSVKHTLCNDTPEEHVSDELDEEDDIGTKDILSYSWRALKEASLLLRTIVKTCPLSNSNASLMTSQQLRNLGDLSFTQLAELRHRGAFSTVSQTFATCCMRCNSGSEATSGVLQGWYMQALCCIQNQTTINTRRSAGIPSLMVGIILADDSKGDLFQRAVRDLTIEATIPVSSEANQDGGLAQVHAMNCLKDMFRNSKLGAKSEMHVPEALGLAANCLSSEIWAIRNGGLMLFRALLDRLLGSGETYTDSDSGPQSRLSFAAVPNLTAVILDLISPPLDTTKELLTEGVFPALQLLQRTPPPLEHRPAILAAVRRLTSSSQWHIRDKAAQTYAILTMKRDRVAEACKLIHSVPESYNATHGLLLTAMHILESTWKNMKYDDLNTILAALNATRNALYYESSCPYTKCAFVDIYGAWCQAAFEQEYVVYGNNSNLPLPAADELQAQMNLARDDFAAASALRQSLAHATVRESVYLRSRAENVDGHLATLVKLASLDPDACTEMLSQGSSVCSKSERFCNIAAMPLVELCSNLLFQPSQAMDLEVQAAAQEVLLTLLDSKQAHVVQNILRRRDQKLRLTGDAETPLLQDKRIMLQGALLELRFSATTAEDSLLSSDFRDWTLSITTALHENNPYDTRYAAADAASRLKEGLRVPAHDARYNISFLAYCHAVYQLTNDDDEDVRNVAAKAACSIIQIVAPNKSTRALLPLAAGARLAETMAQRFTTNQDLSKIATQTLYQKNESLSAMVEDVKNQNTALFMQEKQNLFLDEVREARLWSHVLMSMSEQAFSKQQVHGMISWVQEGLDTLLVADDAGANGPLGWMRRPKAFVGGLKVFYAAEVLLDLRGRSKLFVVPSAEMRSKLVQLLAQAEETEMHPLWQGQIESVLHRAVLRGVRRLAKTVAATSERMLHA